jgi:hypothetical protein
MGYQLWVSQETGYRRQGTRFESLHDVFLEKAKLSNVCEPILCCKINDNADDTRHALESRDFDVTCVIDENGNIIGQIERESLGTGVVSDHVKKIEEYETINEDTSLVNLLSELSDKNYKYVVRKERIIGIITRSDLNKPIPRTYLFGVISLFELHLNFWINSSRPNNSWLSSLKEHRAKSIQEMEKIKKENGSYLSLIECAQLCDKKEILKNTPEFLKKFNFSKKNFSKLMEKIEVIRNDIAHSQSSIITLLEWKVMTQHITKAETFLRCSDDEIEKEGLEKAKPYQNEILVPILVM